MPRYFFDMTDGHETPDTEGTDLPDVNAAVHEAYRILCQIVPIHEARLRQGEALMLTLADEAHMSLMRLELHTTLAPALGPPR